MARVTGPLLSMAASGSVAGTMVFSTWKGRPYVRQLVTPANPNSPLQVSTRAMMKFISQGWANIGTTKRATWQSQADQLVASLFNAYTSVNMGAWTDFSFPSQDSALTRTAWTGTWNGAGVDQPTATGGSGQFTVVSTTADPGNMWGLAIFANLTTSVTPARDNLFRVMLSNSTSTFTSVVTGLDAGTYKVKTIPFTEDGGIGANTTERDAVVT